MIQAILFLLLLAVLLIPALWLAFHPGLLVIEWLGWRVESDLATLTLLLFLIFILIRLLMGIFSLVMARPRGWWRRWREVAGRGRGRLWLWLIIGRSGGYTRCPACRQTNRNA